MHLQKSNFMKRMNSLVLDSSQESESSIESVELSLHDQEEFKSGQERQSNEDELFNTNRLTHSIVKSEA